MLGQPESAAFESPLERDFYVLLDFNPAVARVEVQPVRIEYLAPDGRKTHYTPDALIFHTPESGLNPVLCEVKPHAELAQEWEKLRPRFKAAVRHCRHEGWVFHIYTDREIRTPYLENVRFLRGYVEMAPNEIKRTLVRRHVGQHDYSTIGEVLAALCPVMTDRGPWLSLIWHMIATAELDADLDQPLAYATPVCLPARGPT